jgi:probable F420-dependent oxidoreductase
VFLAGVGPHMTEVAGEVCDGFIAHGFTTEKYLREVSIPTLQRGMEKGGRARADFQVSLPAFLVTGETDEQFAAAAAGTKQQIAFYASTPAYRAVLDVHGWGDLQPELTGLSKRGEWVEMGNRITDDILSAFAVIAPVDKAAGELKSRYGDVIDRISLYTPYAADAEHVTAITQDLRAA